jgi:hypothetical protein
MNSGISCSSKNGITLSFNSSAAVIGVFRS